MARADDLRKGYNNRRGHCDILTVDSLDEAFMWGVDFLVTEEHTSGNIVDKLRAWMAAGYTMSSAYSGIATPETSNGMLSSAARLLFPVLPGDHDLFRPQAYLEIDEDARQ